MSASSSPIQQQINQNLTGSVLPSNVATSSNKSSHNSNVNSNYLHGANSSASLISQPSSPTEYPSNYFGF